MQVRDILKSKPFIISCAVSLLLVLSSLGYILIYMPQRSEAFPEPEDSLIKQITELYTERVEIREEENKEEEEEEEADILLSPYTGLPYKKEMLERPFAIMIDNHPGARPQFGLQDASYVYEIIAEGEITRLMAIFHHEYGGELGPVRSLRPYYAHMARENDAIMAHCGSSRQTGAYLSRSEYASVDEHRLSHKYYRDYNRRAPHNLFTNIDRLIEGAKQLNIYGETFETRKFTFVKGDNSGPLSEVRIPFDNHNIVTYRWDDSEKTFMRFINNRPHVDAGNDDSQVTVNNIIVQYSDYRFISNVHREYSLIGSGTGLLIKEGSAEVINWEKTGYDKPTEFFCEDGSPVILTPGNTWIHIIAPRKEAVLIEE